MTYWEIRFDRKFGKYMFGMLSKEECLSVKTFISQILSRQREEMAAILKSKKKKIDKRYSTDGRRYPHGYNKALDELTQILDDVQEREGGK